MPTARISSARRLSVPRPKKNDGFRVHDHAVAFAQRRRQLAHEPHRAG